VPAAAIYTNGQQQHCIKTAQNMRSHPLKEWVATAVEDEEE